MRKNSDTTLIVKSRKQRNDFWKRQHRIWSLRKKYRYLYLMLLPLIIYYLIFNYVPMYGIVMAFKHFRFNAPSAIGDIPLIRYIGQTMNMEWVGLKWFNLLWSKADFWRAFKNTLLISLYRLLWGFPAPLILALLMNEVRSNKLKRFFQTAYTFPHFLSWVLVMGVLYSLISFDGLFNQIIGAVGGKPISFLTTKSLFRPIVVISSIWKNTGWGTIIYLAAISGIDPQLYEAATIDGANRFQNVVHITWPGIKSTAVILLILQCGQIMNAGFTQILNLYNPAVYEVGDIIDTYIYRISFFGGFNKGFSVASGLFKSVINFVLLMSANWGAKLLGEQGLY